MFDKFQTLSSYLLIEIMMCAVRVGVSFALQFENELNRKSCAAAVVQSLIKNVKNIAIPTYHTLLIATLRFGNPIMKA